MNKKKVIFLFIITGFFVFIITNDGFFNFLLGGLFPNQKNILYNRQPMVALVGSHLELVMLSSLLAVLIGVTIGLVVTRKFGRKFLPLVNELTSFGQTFPPVAILALSVPILGFGFKPTILALVVYSILPIVENTVSGIQSIPDSILDTAKGVGMNKFQVLYKIELPLSLNIILGGIRTSVIINIGTATVGATIGAGGLGKPIIAGLVNQNSSYLLHGALVAAFMAFIIDYFFSLIIRSSKKEKMNINGG
ncbi:MAG: ABC transporter permease [Candidatus Mcinerneyibacterium aminivorans]|uniref:ABC transporter permease n=1 Tax=Candidatus Mcinerneyibacterium aminivorans TaxID=2703815 RepID=A0A5D0MKK5_9BACT|nr:MAG: ABC transporter permease [Candidatus Mcinerneyibacterium aminivorans]